MPRWAWKGAWVAYHPIRVYLRAGDWLLFRLWLASRRPLWWLADRMARIAE
jgi:hypothetical protein